MMWLEVWSSGDTRARVIVEIVWSGGHRIVISGHRWSKAGMIGCCLHHHGRVVDAGRCRSMLVDEEKVEHAEVITPSKKFCQVPLLSTVTISSSDCCVGYLNQRPCMCPNSGVAYTP